MHCFIYVVSSIHIDTNYYTSFSFLLIGAIGVFTPKFGVGASTDPILLSNVNCSGQEMNISECNHSGVNNVFFCVHGDDAGVICNGECTMINIYILNCNCSMINCYSFCDFIKCYQYIFFRYRIFL